MKKKYVAIIIVLIVILIGVASFLVYNKIQKDGREYEIERVNNYNYFVLKQNEQYGVIDREGKVIISPNYTNIVIPNPERPLFICYDLENNTKVFNEKNEQILTDFYNVKPIRLKNIASDLMYEKSVLTYEKDSKIGLINMDGKELAKAEYDEISALPYKEGELLIKQNDKYGVINIKGVKLVDILYDQISLDNYYTDEDGYGDAGYIVYVTTDQGYRYGYVDRNGKEIVETQYNQLSRVIEMEDEEDIYLICAKNGQYGVLKNNEIVLENEYQSIRYDEINDVFVVEKNKKFGVSNKEGNIVVPVQYSQIDSTGNYIYAKNEQGTTVYNKDGKEMQMDSNIAILDTANENYSIKINTQNNTTLYGLLDKNGKELIDEKYTYLEYAYESYFIATNTEGKLGIVDSKGNEKSEFKYDSLQKIDGCNILQGVFSQSDKKITDLFSNKVEKFCELENAVVQRYDEKVIVYNDSEKKYFDAEGTELTNMQMYPDNELYAKQDAGKWGFVDKDNNKKVDFIYDRVTEFNEYGFAGVKKDNKWGVINEDGTVVLEPTYERENEEEPLFIGKYYQVQYGFGEVYYTDMNNAYGTN